MLAFLAVLGPGIITASADNDAGGITTYAVAGAKFGYDLLWILLLTTFSLGITQEMGARMGIVTGKGLAALIRERFGVRWTAFGMLALLVANFGSIAADVAGIGAALEIFGISRYLTVPLSVIALYLLVFQGSFQWVERVFLFSRPVYRVRDRRHSGSPRLGTCLAQHGRPELPTNPGLHRHVYCGDWHDDYTLGSVLHPVVLCRQAAGRRQTEL